MNLKNIILALNFIIPFHIHTMDKPIDLEKNEAPQECIFYLAKLPDDIWNLIAQYLTFPDRESQEEFIECTKIARNKEIPDKYYYKDFQAPSKNPFLDLDFEFPDPDTIDSFCGTNNILNAFCPNGIYVALLDSNNLKIINIKTDQLIYTQKLEKKGYQQIAISRNATMFATIDEHREPDNTPHYGEVMRYITTNYLTIKNIATQKAETIELPGNFNLPHKSSSILFAFNKQGTYLILYGRDWTKTNNLLANDMKKDPTPHHLIFPVTVNMDIPENGVITKDQIKARNMLASQKTLQHYFHQKGVCKSIIGGTNK